MGARSLNGKKKPWIEGGREGAGKRLVGGRRREAKRLLRSAREMRYGDVRRRRRSSSAAKLSYLARRRQ